eukprot:Opistho-2@44203
MAGFAALSCLSKIWELARSVSVVSVRLSQPHSMSASSGMTTLLMRRRSDSEVRSAGGCVAPTAIVVRLCDDKLSRKLTPACNKNSERDMRGPCCMLDAAADGVGGAVIGLDAEKRTDAEAARTSMLRRAECGTEPGTNERAGRGVLNEMRSLGAWKDGPSFLKVGTMTGIDSALACAAGVGCAVVVMSSRRSNSAGNETDDSCMLMVPVNSCVKLPTLPLMSPLITVAVGASSAPCWCCCTCDTLAFVCARSNTRRSSSSRSPISRGDGFIPGERRHRMRPPTRVRSIVTVLSSSSCTVISFPASDDGEACAGI